MLSQIAECTACLKKKGLGHYMRVELEELLQKLGVSYIMSPYETMPWLHYDDVQGLTCSAEVRMGPTGEDVEAEIQLLKDEDEDEDDGTTSETGEGDKGSFTLKAGERKQVMWMRADAAVQNQWGPKQLRINDKNYVNEFHNWEGKGCDFFRSCVESLQMGEIPNFEDMIDEHMRDDSFYGGGKRGRIGRKSPNVKPGQLLGMKK